jgi:VWA domain-containing protein
MKRHAALLALAIAVLLGTAPAAQRATREQRVAVSVIDKDGNPVQDLTPADFVVRENDIAREVLRVEPVTDPLQVMLLVDTSNNTQLILSDIRKGLQAFVRTLWTKSPQSHIGLMEFGERPNQLAALSNSMTLFDRGANYLVERSGSGAYLMEGILDAIKALKKEDAKRPAIVVFVRESSPEFSQTRHEEIEGVLKKNGVVLSAIVLEGSAAARMSDAGRSRDIVLGDMTVRSGGIRDLLLDRNGIEPRFHQVAERLTSESAVVYGRPESLIPPSKLEVTSKRPGVRVLAPRWTGQ